MPPDSTVSRMLRQCAGTTKTTREYADRFANALSLWVYNHVGNLKTDTVYGMIHYMAKEQNIKHVMIDSLVKCGVNSEKNEPQKAFISKIQDIAKEHKIHIHIVHHTRKGQHETDRPDKYSVKGAGEIVDLTDNLILVSRDKKKENEIQKLIMKNEDTSFLKAEKPDCYLSISKQRHGDFEGVFGFWFDSESTQWLENNSGVRHNYVN
jgi:twinkle protein